MYPTPATAEASYQLLLTTLPFRRWNLPHHDALKFSITLHKDREGHFNDFDGLRKFHEIAISARYVRSLDHLNRVMAHEMCHMRQFSQGNKDIHGRHFKRLAALACRRHGWKPEEF